MTAPSSLRSLPSGGAPQTRRSKRSRFSRSRTSCGETPAETACCARRVLRSTGSPSGVLARLSTLATSGSLARGPRRNTTATSPLARRTKLPGG